MLAQIHVSVPCAGEKKGEVEGGKQKVKEMERRGGREGKQKERVFCGRITERG